MKEKVIKKANTKTKTNRLSGKRGKEPSKSDPMHTPLVNDSISNSCGNKECVIATNNEVIIEPSSNQVTALWPAEGILRQALMSYSYSDDPMNKLSSDEVKIIAVTPPMPSSEANLHIPLSSPNVIVIPNSNILMPVLSSESITSNIPTTKSDNLLKDSSLGHRNVTVLYASLDPTLLEHSAILSGKAVETKSLESKSTDVMYTYTTSYCSPNTNRTNEIYVTANSQLHALLNTPVTTPSLHIRNGTLDTPGEVSMSSLGPPGSNSLLNSLLNTGPYFPVPSQPAPVFPDPDVPEILSQLRPGVLPTISSSQVSSVLSAIDASYVDTDIIHSHSQSLELTSEVTSAGIKSKDDVIVVQVLDSLSHGTQNDNSASNNRLRQVGGPVACFKCSHCPLMGLQPLVMAAHSRRPHATPAPRLLCPGCPNVFYTTMALSVHLSQDHGLAGSELKIVLASAQQCSGRRRKHAHTVDDKGVDDLLRPKTMQDNVSTLEPDTLLQSKPEKPITNHQHKSEEVLGHKADTLHMDVSCLPQIDNVGGHLESEGLSIVVDLDPRLLNDCVKIRVRDLGKEGEFHENGSLHEDDREDLDHVLEEDLVTEEDLAMKDDLELEEDLVTKEGKAILDPCEFKSVELVLNEEHVKKRGRPKGSRNINPLNRPTNGDEEKSEKDCGYRCMVQDCLVRLQSHDNIEYHRRCHLNAGYECPECSAEVPAWNRLTTHLWRTHGIDMELYPCAHCPYKTASYSKLVNLHQRIHFDDKPFLCDSCGKGFKNTKQLRNHKVVHDGRNEGPAANGRRCDICSRSFASVRLLRLHQDNVHRKLRPHLCNFCGYSASSRSTLKMHMRQHTGEKPFKCEECEYRTADHNSLRRHKMRHSGNRPYKCPHCSYACIQSSTFKAHLNTKHPGQDNGLMFSCPKCPFRSVKKDNYTAHLAEHSRAEQKPEPEQVPSPIQDMSLVANLDLLYVNNETSGQSQSAGQSKGKQLEEEQVTELEAEEITGDLREPREPKFKVND